MGYVPGQNSKPECGDLSYELIHVSGVFDQLLPDLGIFDLDLALDYIAGIPFQKNWAGQYQIQIKTTLVSSDVTGVRGENGAYESVYSAVADIIISDPCRYSVVNQDQALEIPDELEVP
jgi:hypothetical protein